MIILENKHTKKTKEVHLMLAISSNLIIDCSYTPSWIRSERYLYCDDFAQDLTGSKHASFLASIRKLFHR